MISISISYKSSEYIDGFIVDGHAQYSSNGKDIVCAAVSVLTIGTINSIYRLCEVKLDVNLNDGYIKAFVPPKLDKERHDVELLLQSMVVTLKDLEKIYPNNIQFIL